MGIGEEIIQIVSTGAIDLVVVPDYFWYTFLIICPGYIVGLLLFYSKYQTVDSWFDKSPFDKTIISILFGGLFVILVSLGVKVFYFVQGIEIVLNPWALSIIISILASIISVIIAFWSWKRSAEEKLLRRSEYESRKRVREFVSPEFPMEDLMFEKVSKILNKHFNNFDYGVKEEIDIAIPNHENPKIFIELKAIPTTKSLIGVTERREELKRKFPDAKFVFVTDLQGYPLSGYRKNLLSQFDAVFDIYKISDFEEYIKRQSEIEE